MNIVTLHAHAPAPQMCSWFLALCELETDR